MPVKENLSPFWQNFAFFLLVIGDSLLFISAISTLWGWYVVGLVSCLAMVARLIDERTTIRFALTAEKVRSIDRFFAFYILLLGVLAAIINFIFFLSISYPA